MPLTPESFRRTAARVVAALLAGCLFAALAGAANPVATAPILRVETGSHQAAISRIATDRQGRWVVTVSEDKTARVWDAANGRLLQVLRPPIGDDSQGALYAVAVSPDGRRVALGGHAPGERGSHAVYLFDRGSGTLPAKSTLTGLEAPITQLTWSPDGQFLAIGLLQEGVRVFRSDLGFVGADPEYNEAVFGAAFSPQGDLAVASLDGSIRLYTVGKRGLARVARQQMANGKPYAIAFAPDGKSLAVGYRDSARVDILDATTLQARLALSGRGSARLGRVAWSGDGRTVYAAGGGDDDGRFPLYAFPAGGGAALELARFSDTVLSLAANADGGVFAASAEPAWAAFDGAGKLRYRVARQSADFRDAGDAFRVSQDGRGVAFPLSVGGRDVVSFDLQRGELRDGAASGLAEPRTRKFGLALDDWRNSATPRLGNRQLALLQGELSRSVALGNDGRFVVLGSDWHVRAYDGDGGLRWERRAPASAWAVNVSGDGRWTVAALGDGTVRWYRSSDGREQLALFVHPDRQRWIAWTPGGYYDTSVGGEALVGWHVNRAFNQSADFFAVGRFRERFFRPDVIQAILQTGDEAQALSLAAAPATARVETKATPAAPRAEPKPAPVVEEVTTQLPPVVELRSDSEIESTATTVPVRFVVRSAADAPPTGVKVRVNEKLVRNLDARALRGTRGSEAVQEVMVPVPPTDALIRLFAENRNGKSEAAVIRVKRSTAKDGKTPPPVRYETLHLLVVGVSDYPAQWKLDLPSKDARDFAAQMARQTGTLYTRINMRQLIDRDASRDAVIEGFKWLRQSVGENDVGMVFLAGHGDRAGNTYYFIPHGRDSFPAAGEAETQADFDKWKQRQAKKVWVSGDEIASTLLSLKGRAALFVDTCHAGLAARQAKTTPTKPDMTGTLNEIDEEKGVIVFASSTGKEPSQENLEWGNGAFTAALIEGMRGKAAREGYIRPSLLNAYVNDRVRQMTRNEQRPVIFTVGIDDPIAESAAKEAK